MSALTFESFCEMSQNQNHERYVLYSGRPKLMLDKKQFQCLKFYVKKARRRVIKALNEVNEHADSTYLFITYDGKSLPNDFQRRKPTLKTLHASTSSSDTSITDESDIMSQSDSQISDDEFESDYVQNLETSLSTTQRAICFGERTFNSRMATESESIVNGISTSIPQSGLMPQNILEAPETLRIIEEEDDTPVDIEDSLKGLCDSTDSKIKRMDVPENSNELIEQKMDVAGTYASVQNERVGTTSADKQLVYKMCKICLEDR
ncbi:uncharacterized protein LOC123542875 isoform X2 [Mercenaria mercenaria]|uniref:uncharacterized protein LOC123542875 isoform X2 n=1 Tax=Mercenaria mercenaria TaxID=6596 RepID=UPI00234ECEB4|nr:uncharacterized protein LOC123542875 isoform X2 [Mercenaria mercenaria]